MTATAPMPNVFVVGSGPVGAALAASLRRAGVPVLGIFGRRPEAVRVAASIAGVAGFSAAPPDLMLEAQVVIVAVRDDDIAQAARTVIETGYVTRRHVLLHCSGAMSAAEAFGADVIAEIAGAGTLHPLRSIADARQAAATMKGTVFGVEGDPVGRALAYALVTQLGGTAIDLDAKAMPLYHAAAALASNFVVALFDAAGEALAAAGVPREIGGKALLPLLAGTVDNLGRVGLPRALTGPIARGDVGTVARHLQALAERAPSLLSLYRELGRRALAIAERKGDAGADDLAEIARALEVSGRAP